MRKNGGNEFNARIELIGRLLDRLSRMRRVGAWENKKSFDSYELLHRLSPPRAGTGVVSK
jgi:hypothetical protein